MAFTKPHIVGLTESLSSKPGVFYAGYASSAVVETIMYVPHDSLTAHTC